MIWNREVLLDSLIKGIFWIMGYFKNINMIRIGDITYAMQN
mgnify:CR=1 FL=1